MSCNKHLMHLFLCIQDVCRWGPMMNQAAEDLTLKDFSPNTCSPQTILVN
jgi:hypothetical protein